jgi:glyoxylase-like metal-dependent hydrolase (beta-lactamase superfamily II)
MNEDTAYICVACGTQYPPSAEPPARCAICLDPRQFVGLDGQQWITLEELRRGHGNTLLTEEPGVHSIFTEPTFGIGERAFLIRTPAGNVLWDCIALIDQPSIDAIRRMGGIDAIAISHPHYYTTMIEWSAAFDNAPIHIHASDQAWVMRPHENVRFWLGETLNLLDGLTLIHTPGHFDGFQVLHWRDGAGGKGVLFSADQP